MIELCLNFGTQFITFNGWIGSLNHRVEFVKKDLFNDNLFSQVVIKVCDSFLDLLHGYVLVSADRSNVLSFFV